MISVGASRPRLLEKGAPPPAPEQTMRQQVAGAQQLVSQQYWTPDKAERLLARCAYSLSRLYGDAMKVDKVELEIAGPAVSAVLNDWVPTPASGAEGDKWANLVYLLFVVGLLVLFRLPDILEAHDMLPDWANRARRRRQLERGQQPGQPAAGVQPAAAPRPGLAAVVEVDSMGNVTTPAAPPAAPASSTGTSGEDRIREQVFGEQLVGGRGYAQAAGEVA